MRRLLIGCSRGEGVLVIAKIGKQRNHLIDFFELRRGFHDLRFAHIAFQKMLAGCQSCRSVGGIL